MLRLAAAGRQLRFVTLSNALESVTKRRELGV